MQKSQVVRAPMSVGVIALNYLELHVRSKIWISKIQSPCCWTISNIPFRMKKEKTELWQQKVTVTSVAVATTKILNWHVRLQGWQSCWHRWFFARVGDSARMWTRACVITRVSGHVLVRPMHELPISVMTHIQSSTTIDILLEAWLFCIKTHFYKTCRERWSKRTLLRLQ